MHFFLAFLFFISFLAVVCFLVMFPISFIIKSDNYKKYRKYLGISIALFLVIFIGLCVTNELDNVLIALGYAFGYSYGYLTRAIEVNINSLFR